MVKDRTFIVTGGSRGFGLAIARALVERGAHVALLGRNQAHLEAAVEALGAENTLAITADITDQERLGNIFASVSEYFGRLDGLVNNAGMARPNMIERLVADEVKEQVDTNFLGTVFACQAAIPLLRGGDNPRIVNISSASAVHFDEMSHLSIYAASKAAVERFTRDLASELQADGIGVTCIRPGAADTRFADGWDAEALMRGLEEWRRKGSYMNVGMSAHEVAEAVAFALAQPPGVAVDLLEIRPNQRVDKI
jgi:NAD(P)-dependent dehydrogenase (short-subunit alcohol dehydrogenase family)